uniref:Si:dkeyp-110a12.4 n=1 Tax=Latimeria chalumnae TaxID=7897 RepID=H3A0M4_LATCH
RMALLKLVSSNLVLMVLCLTAMLDTFSAIGVDVEEEMNETVICTKDLMEVEIHKKFFLSKSPPVSIWDLHLNDPDCRGIDTGTSYVFSIKTNLSDCGTITASDDAYITFINTIHNNETEVITRTYINIMFACRYPINYMVQQSNGENMINVAIRTIVLNTEDGNFSVSMILYKDEYFEDRWMTTPSLTLEENIYVKVNMIPSHLIMRLERCWATPTNDPYGPIQYTFIKDSCPEVTNDQMLSVILNGYGPEAMFRIWMFKFVGDSYKDIFLHCDVQICHNTAGVCQPNCTDDRGQTRTRRHIVPFHTVSYGPIRRKITDNAGAGQSTGNLPPVETLILGGLLVAVLVITGIFGKLWCQSREEQPTMQAQLTLSNFHHLEVP